MDTKEINIICPKCQGIPLRYKLVEDNTTLVGVYKIGVMCRGCNGTGFIKITNGNSGNR